MLSEKLFKECVEFVKETMDSLFGLIKYRQLSTAMQIAFEDEEEYVNKNEVDNVFQWMQRKNIILITSDGWVMTSGRYAFLYDDQAFKRLAPEGARTRIEEPFGERYNDLNEYEKDMLDCYWVLMDYLPSARGFMRCSKPFTFSFCRTNDESGKLEIIDIVRIRKETAQITCSLLRKVPNYKVKNIKNNTTRIAVVDDADCYTEIPRIGFKQLVALRLQNFDRWVEVASIPDDEMWSYYPENE